MTDEEFWRERLNRLDRGLGHAPRGVFPGDRLAYVTSRPADEKRFYRAIPATILGPEVEGGEAQVEADDSGEMLVYPVDRNPIVGEHVVVSGVTYRLVSEGAGHSILPRQWCIAVVECRGFLFGCPLAGLTVTVTGPNDQEYSGVTDSDGTVCFTVDGDGSYTATVTGAGFWQGGSATQTITGDLTTNIILQPVSGRVCFICNGACPPYPLLSTLNWSYSDLAGSGSGTVSFLSGSYTWATPPRGGVSATHRLTAGGTSLVWLTGGLGLTWTLQSITCDPFAASFASGSGHTMLVFE